MDLKKLITFSFLLGFLAAPVFAETVIEDFEDSIPLSEWSGNKTMYSVDCTLAVSGGCTLKADGSEGRLERQVNNYTNYSFSMRIDKGEQQDVRLYDNGTNTIVFSMRNDDGDTNFDIEYFDGSWNQIASNAVPPDTFANFTLEIDYSANTFTAKYRNGTVIGSGLSFRNSGSETTKYEVLSNANVGGTGGNLLMYHDYIFTGSKAQTDSTKVSVTIDRPLNRTLEDSTPLLNGTVNEKANLTYTVDAGSSKNLCDGCTSFSTNISSISDGKHNITVSATDYDNASDSNSKTRYFTINKSESEAFTSAECIFGSHFNISSGDPIDRCGSNNPGASNIENYRVDGISKVSGDWGTDHSLEFNASEVVVDSGNTTAPIAVSVWANADKLNDSNIIFSQGNTRFYIGYDRSGVGDSTNGFECNIYDGSNHNTIETGVTSTDVWHHFVFTYDGSNAYCYVDNLLKGSKTVSQIDQGLLGQSFGTESGSASDKFFYGSIDEPHIYSKNLSSSEVTNLYDYNQLTDVSTEPNLSITINNPTNTTITDSTPAYDFSFNEEVNASYSVDGGSSVDLGNQITSASGNLSSLSDGQHSITVSAKDYNNGSDTETKTRYFTVDTSPPTLTINTANNSQYFKRNITVNYSASNYDSIKYHVEPAYTPVGEKLWLKDSGATEFQVNAVPGNITTRVTVNASNSVGTTSKTLYLKNGLEKLRVVVIGDPSFDGDQNEVDRLKYQIKDLEESLPHGWDFTLVIGDQTQYTSGGSTESTLEDFNGILDIYNKNTSVYLRRDRIAFINGNHDYDRSSVPSGLSTYIEKFHRFYYDSNAPKFTGNVSSRAKSPYKGAWTNSYNIKFGNLFMMNLIGDNPAMNRYDSDGNGIQNAKFMDYENSTEFYNYTVRSNQPYIITTQTHGGLWNSTGNLDKARGTVPGDYTDFDMIHDEVGTSKDSGIYQRLPSDSGIVVDLWWAGHFHTLGGADRYYFQNYGIDNFYTAYYSKQPSDSPTLSTVMTFTQGSSEVKVRYRDTWSQNSSGQWGGGLCRNGGVNCKESWKSFNDSITVNVSNQFRFKPNKYGVFGLNSSESIVSVLDNESLSSGKYLGNKYVYGKVDGEIVSKVQVDLTSSDYDASGLVLDVSTSNNGKAVVDESSNQVMVDALYVPDVNESENSVTICPDASKLSEVSVSCDNSITVSSGSSKNGYSVSTVSFADRDYHKVTGISGTGVVEGSSTNSPPSVSNVVANPDPVNAGNTVNITADVSDSNLDGLPRINLTAPNGTQMVGLADMKNSSASVDSYYYTFDTNRESGSIGDWTVDIQADDTDGAVGTGSTTFHVTETEPPLISFNPSTTGAGTVRNNWIFVNISASDSLSGLDVVRESFDSSNSSFVTSSNGNYWTNHTNLADGTYTVYAWANDTESNSNQTMTRTITVDTPTANSKKFVVDRENDFSSGQQTNTNFKTGDLKLRLSNTDNDQDIAFIQSGIIKYYDYSNGNVYTTGVSADYISTPCDIGSDSDSDIPYVVNKNLKYYDTGTGNTVDTNKDVATGSGTSDFVGQCGDVGSDGDKDIIYVNGGLNYYDTNTGTSTEKNLGNDDVAGAGFLIDADGDGSADDITAFIEDSGTTEYGGGSYGYWDTSDGSTTTASCSPCTPDSLYELGDGYGPGGTKKGSIADTSGSGALANVTTTGAVDISATGNELGEVKDLDSDGNKEILIADSGDLKFFDPVTESYTNTGESNVEDVEGVGDVAFASNGRYITKSFDAGDRFVWKNVTLGGLTRPGTSSVNMTVQTSSDSFSTINESKTFTDSELIDGTNTYTFNLNNGTQYVRVKIWMTKGSTPSLDNITVQGKVYNDPPTFSKQELYWENIGGGGEYTRVNYTVTDPNGNENADTNSEELPSGTSVFAFTNTTYSVQGIGNSFDYIPSVSDFLGAVGKGPQTNLTLTHQIYVENSTGTVNTSWQSVNTTVTVKNRGEKVNYTLSDSVPSVLKSTVVDGDTSKNNLAGTDVVDWQYLVDHVSVTTFSKEKDTSKSPTIDTQYLKKERQAYNNWSTSYSRLKVDSAAFSSFTCSNCNTRTISIQANSKKNVTFNASGDALSNEKQFKFKPATDSVTLGVSYVGKRNFQIKENQKFTWKNIDIIGNVTASSFCGQSNNTAVDVPASSFSNYTVGFNCEPGDIGNPTQDVVNISDGSRIWINSTDMNITTNETQGIEIAIRTKKSQWRDSDSYDAGSLKAYVEGNSTVVEETALNVTDTGSYFRIEVGSNFQQSSLHTDDDSWSITYTSTSDSSGGGGGGGGGGTDGTQERTVYFGSQNSILETVSGVPGGTVKQNITITNTVQRELTVNVDIGDSGVCQYIEVRESLTSNQFGDNGVYQMPAATQVLGTVQVERQMTVKVSLPNSTEIPSTGFNPCKVSTVSSYGTTEKLDIGVNEAPEILQGFFKLLRSLGLFEEVCVNVPTSELAGNMTSIESSSNTVCFVVWQPFVSGIALFGGLIVYWRRKN